MRRTLFTLSLAGIVMLVLLPICVAVGLWPVGGEAVHDFTGTRAFFVSTLALALSVSTATGLIVIWLFERRFRG